MARNIDWTKPLSPEDKAWALQRDMHDKVEANEAEFGKGDLPAGAERDKRIEELRAQITELDNELTMLLRNKAEEENLGGAVVRGGAPQSAGTFTEGEGSQTGKDPSRTYDDPSWTRDRLISEIDKRNAERAAEGLPELSTRGNKAELVERLMQDDAEVAEADRAGEQ